MRITSIIKQCEQCRREFVTLDVRKRFCNRSCSASFTNNVKPKRTKKFVPYSEPRKSLVERWLAGECDGTTKYGLSEPIRKYLLSEAGFKCDDCEWSGFNPVSGKSTLQIEHIDGNSSNNCKSNLKVLCPNCHSLTPTYGALNKGNGRKARYGTVAQSVEHDIANVEAAGS